MINLYVVRMTFLSLLSIPVNLTLWFGALAFVLLMFTPGAWITFGPVLDRMRFGARLFTAVVLSPLILSAEFYAIRILGIPFAETAVLLVFVNLPAVYLIWKRYAKDTSPDRLHWVVRAAIVIIPVACMMDPLIHVHSRIYAPHGWYHADAAYMFARGDLVLEDATLAGVRLSYPVWTSLMFQAVQSFLLDSPPLSSFVWGNLLWLIAVYYFCVAITREMGGGTLAQVCSGLVLLLGTNPIGYILMKVAPEGNARQLWGDARYTPWFGKFLVWSPMALALGMLMALIYLLVRSGPLTKGLLTLVFLMLCGIGLLYPLLLPPACGVIAARAIAPLTNRPHLPWPTLYKEWLAWAALLVVALLLTFGEVKFLTSDRSVSSISPVLLSSIGSMARKTFTSMIAMSLFVAGLAFTFRECWASKRAATTVLLGGALASLFLFVIFFIPFYENEYKFIFSAAMCLAVFSAIAIERIWSKWPRAKAVPLLGSIFILLLGTYGHYAHSRWAPSRQPENAERMPLLNTSGFYLQLDPRETWAGICNAVLRLTPSNSILVVNNESLYYSGLTARSLYVSAANSLYAGVNIPMNPLEGDLRGYGLQIVEQRRATMTDLFGMDDNRREHALNEIRALKRPVAIITEPQNSHLLEWLEDGKIATQLYTKQGLSLWLISAEKGYIQTTAN